MSVWSGLGFNFSPYYDVYSEPLNEAENLARLTELRKYVSKLRLVLPDYDDTSAVARTKAAVIQAKNLGFYVVYGTSSNPNNYPTRVITSRNIATFNAAMLDFAAWCEANGVDEMSIGNEEEEHRSHTVTVTRSGTTATATADELVTIDYEVNDVVTVSGASQNEYNGDVTVTGVSANTFTYEVAGSPATPATGTIKVSDLTDAEIRSNVKTQATLVQAIFSGIVTYSIDGRFYADWITDGVLGDLDTLSINLYGQNDYATYSSSIDALITEFGASAITLSEFGIHGSWTLTNIRGQGITSVLFDEIHGAECKKYLDKARDSGISEAYFFIFQTVGDTFSARLENGSYRDCFQALLGGRKFYANYQ